MTRSFSYNSNKSSLRIRLCSRRHFVWWTSGIFVALSLLGLLLCFFNPSIKAPLRPGIDFTGGTQIQLERTCDHSCDELSTTKISEILRNLSISEEETKSFPKISDAKVQFLDDSKSLVLRLPFLSASQGQSVIAAMEPIAGPFQPGGQAINTIGPSLGGQLLKSSLISLLAAFAGIALYISLRYDQRFAVLALIALGHDVIIVCGVFAWLGLLFSLEVNSLFAVALLTIAGYSVNDTVVVFDRIRERARVNSSLDLAEQIDRAVSSTLTRTLYTSGTTLLPLLALIFFGGSTLYWFAIALALGVVIGSWSSIALAPSLLSLSSSNIPVPIETQSEDKVEK
ncbi:protein translocase subunit SecF [Prochlorococcus sp. MIT 1307]|uniref:protein translocase subunit SecF n=1 Tax=Prochlorococcus sp. MIT 1307 TaxID=3096219 RepID=UPI002A7486B8|nr:protein translocase subunit SecF [Prochlorococcus sp. MIT 1307]